MFLATLFYLLIFPVALLLCIYLGSYYARKVLKKKAVWKPVGIEAGLMGIFALVISFSLLIAGNHARERTTSIHQESDDLALLLRKSKFYEPELQQEVKKYMTGFYTIQLNNLNPRPEESAVLVNAVEQLDSTLDEFLKKYLKTHPAADQQINELIGLIESVGDKYFLLLYSYSETTPKLIGVLMVIFGCLMGILVGFMNRMQENKYHITLVIFIIVVTIMIYSIHDLDSPATGLIRPDYTDIINIKQLMDNYYDH
jgi:hypothetical protein